jgi:hypothetical protein
MEARDGYYQNGWNALAYFMGKGRLMMVIDDDCIDISE